MPGPASAGVLFQSPKEWFQKNTKSVGLEFLLSEVNESCGRDSDKLIMLCLLCFHRLKKKYYYN